MNTPANFHEINSVAELPQQDCSVSIMDGHTVQDAIQQAITFPERTIYWVKEKHIVIWYTPLLRSAYLPMALI